MAVINPVGFLHNVSTHTAQIDRLSSGAGFLVPDAVGSLRPTGGIRRSTDYQLTAPGAMVVRVSAGLCWVPQGQSVQGGAYAVPNDGNVDLTISTAHATLTRWDLIAVRVQDGFYAGSNNTGDIIVIAGTAAGSPSDPALPAGSSYLVLGRVVVGPGVTSIVGGNITYLALPVELIGIPQLDRTLGDAYIAAQILLTGTPGWTDLCTVTATASTGTGIARWSASAFNGGSGADRTIDLRVVLDGSLIGSAMTGISIPLAGSPRMPRFGFASSVPGAGSHTWKLQGSASVASAVYVESGALAVVERRP